MKKLFLIIGILICLNPCYASTNGALLDNIEKSLYGFTYTTSDDATRLSRIEQSVYGQTKDNKTVPERISALKKDISAEQIGHEIAPKEDTFMEDSDSYKEDRLAQEKMPPAGANVDYPSINELETIFIKFS